jgi:hypothetical protein
MREDDEDDDILHRRPSVARPAREINLGSRQFVFLLSKNLRQLFVDVQAQNKINHSMSIEAIRITQEQAQAQAQR